MALPLTFPALFSLEYLPLADLDRLGPRRATPGPGLLSAVFPAPSRVTGREYLLNECYLDSVFLELFGKLWEPRNWTRIPGKGSIAVVHFKEFHDLSKG